MKALRLHARGGPEQLSYDDDAPRPQPGPGEVLVRVHAAGLTPTELTWDETYRYADGRPRLPSTPGHDVSGTVAELGPDSAASGFAVGDGVFGLVDFPRDGSAAEYVAVPAADLAAKPRSIDHAHAAAVPLSALTAWQALFDHAHLGPGGRVLVHGAAGGVGAYAVQLARWRGIEVLATASARRAEFVRSLGAARVIDYAAEPFEAVARDVDAVIDPFGGDVRARSWRTLRPGGVLVALSAPIGPDEVPRSDVTGTFFIVRPSRPQLTELAQLIDAGLLRPFIEATYPLAQGRQAFERAVAGHLAGKIVLTMES